MDAMRVGHLAEARAMKERIDDLKRLVFSPTSATEIPLVAREADAIISINEKMPDRPDSDMTPDDMRAFDLLVSGEHEEGLQA